MRELDSEASTLDTSTQLHVVIVAPSLRQLIGGQEVQADLLLRNWQNDPAVRVSFVAKNTEIPAWIERIPYVRTVVRFPVYLFMLVTRLRKGDIAHIFSAAGSSFLVSTVPAYWVAKVLGKKTVIHYHSSSLESHLDKSPLAREVLKNAHRVVVPSAYFLGILRRFQIEGQALPNVIDLEQFNYRDRHPLEELLLCTRNFEPRYGIDMVVRAFAQVQREFPNARLCLVGIGPEESNIRRLIADLKVLNVDILGRVSRDKIANLYQRNGLFVNGSRVDNMPVSIIEAFASGMPVVTTNAGGIPFMVEHEQTGLLCDKHDWRSLATNVVRLLREPALAARITENAHRRSERYGWKTVRDQWLEVYRGVTIPH